jgi:hypothetical protein
MERTTSFTPELRPHKRHELLTGKIFYPMRGYTGYGNAKSANVADFIGDEMRADWQEHRDELIAFWKSGEYTAPDIFPDSRPWLFVCGSPNTLPWAAEQFD